GDLRCSGRKRSCRSPVIPELKFCNKCDFLTTDHSSLSNRQSSEEAIFDSLCLINRQRPFHENQNLMLPRINTVYLRSDNAGCYHCGSLWLAIPKITETTGITIARYDYSEPQNGKSYCDAKIAHMRGKIRRSAASGSDVLTASDMKMAIDKHGGVTSCQAAYVAVDPNSLVKKITCPIKAITKISNVRFNNDDTITAWKAFEIGNGKKISINSTLNDVELNVECPCKLYNSYTT
ncbi:Hypothetical predicted protein, partial [Mytilus galloprovincialis]